MNQRERVLRDAERLREWYAHLDAVHAELDNPTQESETETKKPSFFWTAIPWFLAGFIWPFAILTLASKLWL